jgi:hypothetical protein
MDVMARLFLVIVLLVLGVRTRMTMLMMLGIGRLLGMLLMSVRMVLGIVRLVMVRLWQRLSVLWLMLIALPLTARRIHRFPALILVLERLLCLCRLRKIMRRGGKVVMVSLWLLLLLLVCNWVQLVLDWLGLGCAFMHTGHSA